MKSFCSALIIILITAGSFSLAQEKTIDLLPKINGDARMWYDVDLTKNQGNFLVRNTRLLISGSASEFVNYKFLLDFAALAKTTTKNDTLGGRRFLTDASTDLGILNDANISVKPMSKLSFTMGQFKVPFSTDNLISTSSIPFSNRPLLAAKVTPDMYDIGFMASYSLPLPIPVDIDAAAFNGTGQNKTDNDKSANYAFRALVKPFEGFNVSGNYAGGLIGGNKVNMLDFGLGYKFGNLTLAGEYAKRNTEAKSGDFNADSYFGYAVYDIPVSTGLVRFVSPALRYEYYEPSSIVKSNEFNRLTAGLTISFAKLTFAHLRINYEKFSYKDEYKGADKSSDRLIFEYQVRF